MITFKCLKDDCNNKDIEYNFITDHEYAMCGGCKARLTGYDLRPNPEPVAEVVAADLPPTE